MALEKVKFEGMQQKATELDGLFESFATKLKTFNDEVNELVNVDPRSAFYGVVGTNLLSLWNQNAANFDEFKQNFKMWSDTIAAITAKDKETIAKVLEIYSSSGTYTSLGDYVRGEFASDGSELSGVAENRAANFSDASFYGEDIQVSELAVQGDASSSGVIFTGHSGNKVLIDEVQYTVYGYAQKPNGEVISMYADAEGKLFYMDSSGKLCGVQEAICDGFGGVETTDGATINSMGTRRENSNGYEYDTYLKVGDMYLNTSADISKEAILSGSSLDQNVSYVDTSQGIDYGITGDSLTATYKDSMYSSESGSVVNGLKVGVPTSMQSLVEMADSGTDVIRLDPQYKVQWDDPDGGVGYTFQNSNEPVFLVRTSDGSGFQIADEYGNITDNTVYSMDGFNSNGGIDGGVWKNR